MDNWFNQMQWFISNGLESSVGEWLREISGITYEVGKVSNNITIARSILSGEVKDHIPTNIIV